MEKDSSSSHRTSINIGNNNRIKKSNIFINDSDKVLHKKLKFYEKHPVISSVLISLVTGFVFLFSFWNEIIDFIESIF